MQNTAKQNYLVQSSLATLSHETKWAYSTGRAIKKEPLGKIQYLWNGSKFFHQIYSAYRGGFRPHILQKYSQYLVVIKNYNYLNLNVYFSKCTSN